MNVALHSEISGRQNKVTRRTKELHETKGNFNKNSVCLHGNGGVIFILYPGLLPFIRGLYLQARNETFCPAVPSFLRRHQYFLDCRTVQKSIEKKVPSHATTYFLQSRAPLPIRFT